MILAKMELKSTLGNTYALLCKVNDDLEMSYALKGSRTCVPFSLSNMQLKQSLPTWAGKTPAHTIAAIEKAVNSGVYRVVGVEQAPRVDETRWKR